jgi:hypothetical protein
MIFGVNPTTIWPGITGIVTCAVLWVLGMMIVLFHRAGLQVIGAFIAIAGVITLLTHSQVLLSTGLMFFGLLIHGFGRLLFHLRRRD